MQLTSVKYLQISWQLPGYFKNSQQSNTS